jgi:alpha-N-arabinofuranosidase
LQAMVLTQGEEMILTPTYHVFEMYKVHHDATMLPMDMECADYQFGDEKVLAIDISASKDKSGKIHVSLCNLDPVNPADVACKLLGVEPEKVSGRVLTADDMTAHNTFDKPEKVKPAGFNDFSLRDDMLNLRLPAKSVVILEIE